MREDDSRSQAEGGWPEGWDERGQDAPGWDAGRPPPEPPEPPEAPGRRRGGRVLAYLGIAVLASAFGAGVTVALNRAETYSADSGPAAGIAPQHDDASGSGSAVLNQRAVESKVEPGLVDIVSTLRYSSETAEGTGMVISASGLVLTNNHVIYDATSVTGRLAGSGRTYRVRVLGYDATDDIALLQLQGASGLSTVTFGNSDQIAIGTRVLALGNAEGRGGITPAAGIINALGRSIKASDRGSGSTETLHDMLQTSAQIQQGDSGGALANGAGQVIGMITAANTTSSALDGTIGFAIPINAARSIAVKIARGQPSPAIYLGTPGFIGVQVAESTSPSPRQQEADQRAAVEAQGGVPAGPGSGSGQGGGPGCALAGLATVPSAIAPASSGALVVGVFCGTAAYAAGLNSGDVITAVNGQPVTTPGSLTSLMLRYHPGDVVSVSWTGTDGRKHISRLTLGAGPVK